MKVYRLVTEVNRYQYFLVEKEEFAEKLSMDCTYRSNSWNPPGVYVYNPRSEVGDFYNFSSNLLISNSKATEILRTFFDMAGEILPLPYQGEVFSVLNVTECINCLDDRETEWLYDPSSNQRVYPIKYSFHANRFTSSRIFKIPETCRGEILVVDKGESTGEEFRSTVELYKLRGLIFEELWSDNK